MVLGRDHEIPHFLISVAERMVCDENPVIVPRAGEGEKKEDILRLAASYIFKDVTRVAHRYGVTA